MNKKRAVAVTIFTVFLVVFLIDFVFPCDDECGEIRVQTVADWCEGECSPSDCLINTCWFYGSPTCDEEACKCMYIMHCDCDGPPYSVSGGVGQHCAYCCPWK